MTGEATTFLPTAGPATLAELRDMAHRTDQHVGVVGPSVTVLPDRTIAARCIYFRRPLGRETPGHFVGSAQAKVREVTDEARRTVAGLAELAALVKAYPEFAGMACPEPLPE